MDLHRRRNCVAAEPDGPPEAGGTGPTAVIFPGVRVPEGKMIDTSSPGSPAAGSGRPGR
jgi:hypothetical protein